MNFYKTQNIKTNAKLIELIEQYKDFIDTGEGKPPAFLNEFSQLVPYENGETTYVKYTWIDQTEKEIENEEIKERAEIDLIERYKNNPEEWRNEVIKKWSMKKLSEWIDITFARSLEYELTIDQQQERIDKRLELLEYHNQTIYTDDPEKPLKPSYIK